MVEKQVLRKLRHLADDIESNLRSALGYLTSTEPANYTVRNYIDRAISNASELQSKIRKAERETS